MNFKEYKSTSEEIKSAEQMMTPKQQLAFNLREKFLSNNFEIPENATEQQKADVEKETGDVARILNEYGKPWFLGGGTSLELAQGEITRDHHDSDIVMPYENVADFFDYAHELGYRFTDMKEKDILSKEDLVNERENAFLHKIDRTKSGTQGFEIIFLLQKLTKQFQKAVRNLTLLSVKFLKFLVT